MALTSSPDLDLQCWNVLLQYATTGLTLFEAEQKLEAVFQDLIYAYDDSKWRPTINQIICIEPYTDDEVPIISNIQDEIESLAMETCRFTTQVTQSAATPPLPTSSPPPPNLKTPNSPLPSTPLPLPSNSDASTPVSHSSGNSLSLKEWAVQKQQLREAQSVPGPMDVSSSMQIVAAPTSKSSVVAIASKTVAKHKSQLLLLIL